MLVAAECVGHGGGLERYLDVVMPALAARGFQLHVIARKIEHLPAGAGGTELGWADEHDEPSGPAQAATAARIAALRPDIAVAHNVMDAGVVEALRAAPRFAYHVHDHRPFCPNGDRVFPRSGANCVAPIGVACAVHALIDGCAYGANVRTVGLIRRRRRLRDAVAAADAIVVASRYVADRARACGISPERVVTIPLPLPDDAYAAGPPAVLSPASIVFAGRMVPQKGLRSLVRALAGIDTHTRPVLRAFGDGPVLARARADAAKLGVVVDARGHVDAATLRAGIDASALVAFPSRWAEPFGYVGIEAFARARTVVAYDAGGVADWLVDGVNGRLVPHDDEAALGGAIAALLRDDPTRERLATQARRDAERFRLPAVVDALVDAYAIGG